MEIKATTKKTAKGKKDVNTEVNLKAIKAGAQSQVNFLLSKGLVEESDKFTVKGVINGGNKAQMSYALYSNDDLKGIYMSLANTSKPLSKQTVKNKRWYGDMTALKNGNIKSVTPKGTVTIETFDLKE